MTLVRRLAVGLLLVAASAVPAGADIVFPARLDVAETEPGRYDLTFNLPLVQGRVLRAEPSLPPTCHDVTPRDRVATANGVTTTWAVVCDPPSLAGEAILVEGLLGTQTDLAFMLTTLDGRVFNRILRPSRPGFLVPQPPSFVELVAGGGLTGAPWVLRQPALWLLLLVIVLSGARGREVATALAAFAVGAFVALWLASRGWLDVSVPVRDVLLLLTALVPAVRLAGGGEWWGGWTQPAWPVAWLAAALCGGASPDVVTVDGLSRGEAVLAIGCVACGSAVGLALVAAVAIELRSVTASLARDRWLGRATRLLGTVIGALAAGMLVSSLVALALVAPGFPGEPFALALAAAAIGVLLTRAGAREWWAVSGLAAAVGIGWWLGLARMAVPVEGLVVTAVLLALGTAVAVARSLAAGWALPLAAVAAAVAAWSATHALVENVSRSTGASAATVLVAAGVLWASLATARDAPRSPAPVGARALGVVIVLWAVVGRAEEYRAWWEEVVATDASLGLVRLPLAALVLLVVALILWPRRRRVLAELGVERRPTVRHRVALVAALLAVPYGTATMRRPFWEPHAPRGDDARRVAEAVLSGTYHAFNHTDEGEVYDQLAANVTGELVDDLYLDSRRRLQTGTRQGAEVTVRDVDVLDIGEPTDTGPGSSSFEYPCRWTVTSRVRHLQHIHHRRNLYTGMLTLTVEGGRWKIARVDLTSEDRTVIPWKPT